MDEKQANVIMERDGQRTEVCNDDSVKHMEALGWTLVGDKPGDSKPSDGLKVDELKAALEAKGIEIPEGAKKAELQALLDAAA